MTRRNPLPGSKNIGHEYILTLTQFVTKLNPCPCLILTIIARQLLIFSPKLRNLGVIFTDNGVSPKSRVNSILGFTNIPHETIVTLKCLCGSLNAYTLIIWAQIDPKLVIFLPNLGAR